MGVVPSSVSAPRQQPNTSDRDPAATARSRLRSPTGPSAKHRCWAHRGVRCNVVSPGPIFVDGGDWDNIQSARPEIFEATQKTHPGGELGTTQDVANVVAFLVSDAAKHVNGTNVTVDGGFLKRVNY